MSRTIREMFHVKHDGFSEVAAGSQGSGVRDAGSHAMCGLECPEFSRTFGAHLIVIRTLFAHLGRAGGTRGQSGDVSRETL